MTLWIGDVLVEGGVSFLIINAIFLFSYSLVPWSGIACMYSGFISLVFETFIVVRSKDCFNGRLHTFAQRIMHKYEHAKNLTSFVVFCNKYEFFIKQ